jgi:hypothetical protein
MIVNNTLSEIGDVLIIYSQVIVNASISISSYSDNLFGVTNNKFFDKRFRYSLDGLTYSEWNELSDLNLQQIRGIVNGLLFFEFRYERVGTDSNGILEFNGIELFGNIEIQICNNTSTLESIFAELSNNDFYTMTVRNNILRKIFHHGILPKFIDRGQEHDNTDFVSFWSSVCIFLSYFTSFANNFDNLLYKKEYLAEYIKQYGLQLCEKEIIYQHLYFLSTNFYDEIRKRGTQMTIKKLNTELLDGSITEVDGEWLRLICRNHYDEFLFEIIERKHSGYCLGQSSPLYNGTYFSNQLNKTEENTEDFLDLSKYSILGGVTLENSDGKNCLVIEDDSGIGYDLDNPPDALDIKELITVDDSIDYEFTFDFKRKDAGGDAELLFGILCFNRNGVLKINATQDIQDSTVTNKILNQGLSSISKINEQWYSFRGILYSRTTNNLIDGRTNLNAGKHLRIGGLRGNRAGERVKIPVEKIKICLYLKNNNGVKLYVHNLKMRPLVRGRNIMPQRIGITAGDMPILGGANLRNPQFLQSTTFCLNWRRNNNQEKSDNQVDNFIQNYLLPYQQKLVSIPLKPFVDDKQILI